MFSILDKRIQNLIKEKGFIEPTLAQKISFEPILKGKNILLIAQTGIGKTESVFLPILHNLITKEHKPIAVLYITPMRSLNRDLLDRLAWWGSKLDIDISVRHGDTSQSERVAQREMPGHIFITTPETLQAMLTGKKMREHLKNIKYVIIDEIHELVESKRGVQLSLALECLTELSGPFQRIGLSATVGSPELVADYLSKNTEILKAESTKTYDIKIEFPKPGAKDIIIADELFISPETSARLHKLYEIINQKKSVLIFTNTRATAEVISSRLAKLGKYYNNELNVDVHHGSLSKEKRIKAENKFKSQELKSLICTSSLELGIDIGSIEFIVQYLSPRQVSKLIQRVGRGGHRIGLISHGLIISGDEDIFESCIIAKRAMSGKLEQLKMHEMALDVLASQIIGLTINDYDINDSIIYNIVKRSFLFRALTRKQFDEIIKFLELVGLVWLEADPKNLSYIIHRRKRAWDYYFSNLSTIPDTVQYKVISIIEHEPIGSLDEEFVAEHGQPGNKFIVSGRAWKIIQVEGLKVTVEPCDDIESAVPAWEGELIPVPFDISQEVGKMRRVIQNLSEKEVMEKYSLDSNSLLEVKRIIEEQKKTHTVPDDKTILIEDYKDFIIIHSCLGSLVNDTLGRYISFMITKETGVSVNMKNDPYRIMLQTVCSKERVLNIIENAKDIEEFITSSLELSSMFKWRFLHVARRFGIISRLANYDKININKIVAQYQNSPAYKETLRELFLEKMDIENTLYIIEKIHSGKIKLKVETGLSYLGELGLVHKFSEVIKPRMPEKEIFNAFRKRIMFTQVRLVCMNCGDYNILVKVKNIEEQPSCPKCSSTLIGVVYRSKSYIENIIKKKKKKELTEEEMKDFSSAKRSSDLVIVYGKKAVVVLAGRGIGPQTAATILSKLHTSKEALFKDILLAEKNFVRTKKYWKA